MHRVTAIALHDLRLVLTDRSAVMWLFFLPIVFAGFFGLVTRGGSDPTKAAAQLHVLNADGGPVAEFLIQELEGDGLSLVPVNPEEIDPDAPPLRTLTLPEGLSEAVFAGRRSDLMLDVQSGASPDATLVARARIIKAVAAFLGRLVELRAELAVNEAPNAGDLLAHESDEDLVQVASRFAGEARIAPGGFSQSVPGMAVMFVMLVALTYGAAAVSGERSTGMLRRLATTPAGRFEIVAGKIAGRLVIAWLQITILIVVALLARTFIGIDTGGNLMTAWFILAVFAFAVAPLGVALGGWIADPDRASSVGVIATMVMAALGGCWWPLEVVSEPLQRLALALPSGWAMTALHDTISFGRNLPDVVLPIAVLAGFGLMLSAVAARFLRFD